MRPRVVVTGMGAVSPYGQGKACLSEGLEQSLCALQPLVNHGIKHMDCHVAGMVPPVDAKQISRELRRAMSPMSVYATLAAWEALEQAEFSHKGEAPRMGISLGSTLGSPQALHEFFQTFIHTESVDTVRSTTFFKVMSHSVASNVAVACHCQGRVLSPAAACASGLMGIGLGFESILAEQEACMLCGGSDEYHALTTATFHRLGAASQEKDPLKASLPFHAHRSGVVCGEGAGVLVLENLDVALERKAPILAEIRGFAIRNATNIAQPDIDTISLCMQEALESAKLTPADIGYINAHATATEQGDMAEAHAIYTVFGNKTPVSSFKGHLGHTMAACGALESIACIDMLHKKMLWPTLGLTMPDPTLPPLAHVQRPMPYTCATKPLLKNCFALGGCICCLVLDTFKKN